MKNENISYIRYLPNKAKELAGVYCEVFAGPPWYEELEQDKVVADINNEILPSTSAWLAMDRNKVVGFTWGYSKRIPDLEKKLGISLNISAKEVAYQSELGLLSDYRGQRIANNLVRLRLDDFLEQNLEYGIVRTKEFPEPSVTFSWYINKLGYEIMARYPKKDGRVILGRPLIGLKELLV